jgi:hypothetical protein
MEAQAGRGDRLRGPRADTRDEMPQLQHDHHSHLVRRGSPTRGPHAVAALLEVEQMTGKSGDLKQLTAKSARNPWEM